LFEVLDARLKDHENLAGDYSIRDIAHWSWGHIFEWSVINADGLDNLKRWQDAIRIRPAVQKGRAVSECLDLAAQENKETLIKGAQKMLSQKKRTGSHIGLSRHRISLWPLHF